MLHRCAQGQLRFVSGGTFRPDQKLPPCYQIPRLCYGFANCTPGCSQEPGQRRRSPAQSDRVCLQAARRAVQFKLSMGCRSCRLSGGSAQGTQRRNTGGAVMGLADWFSIFCCNIQVQNGAVISLRYKAITRRLNTGSGADRICRGDKTRSALRRCGLCCHDVTPDQGGIRPPWDRNCELAFVNLLGQTPDQSANPQISPTGPGKIAWSGIMRLTRTFQKPNGGGLLVLLVRYSC